MEPGVVVALITASVSLVLAVGKIIWDWREKRHERRLAAREKLDKYRAPLLAAVEDLGRRVNNIRNEGFFAYLHVEVRRDTARLGTLFRFAQYLGWTEIIYGYSDRLRFERDQHTKAVAELLHGVTWALATDVFDRTTKDDFTSSQLMLWREEQRAIGELMRQEGDEARCIGFNSFVDNYESRFSKWFTTFASQLEMPSAPESDRLAELHGVLARLVRELDVDQAFVRLDQSGEVVKPRWAQPSTVAKRPREGTPRRSLPVSTPQADQGPPFTVHDTNS